MKRAFPIWFLFLVALAAPAVAQTLDLTRARIPGGGGVSAGGQFGLFSTVGQAEAAPRSAGGAFTLDTGFLGATIPSPIPTVFFPQGTVAVLEDSGAQARATYAVFEPGQAGEPAQPPTYQLSNNNPALFSVPPAIATNRTLTFTPATNANGTALVTVVVRADGADVATNTFAIVVTAVNDAPSVTLPGSVTVLEDAGAQGISGFAAFTAGPADEAAQTPAYTLTTDNPALFSVPPAIAANGTLTFTPATNANGLATVTVVTVDGGGTANNGADRTTNSFTLTVTAVNDAPAVAYVTNNVAVLEDAGAQSVSGFAAFTAGPADETAQTPAYTLTADNAALFSTPPAIAANGTLTFTPAVNANGSATVTVITADSGGTSGGGVDRSTNTFTITVTLVNDAPSVAYVTNHVVVLEDAGAQSVGGFATFTAGPPDESAQTPAYTLTANNAALFSVQPALAANGTLTFTPAVNANGSAIVTVITADNGGTANSGADRSTNSFTITVTAVNDQPSVSYAMSTVTVLEDAGAQIVSSFATFTAGPADESAQTAAYTLSSDNAALFSVPPAIAPNGTLTFTPAANANGSATVTVVLQDSGGTAGGGVDKATNTFSIAVTAVNDAPAVAFATNNVIAVKDTGAQTATGFAAFTAGPPDESAQTPAYTLTSDNPAFFSTPPAIAPNGTLTFTPAAATEGLATVTVVVQDNGGTANGGGDKATNTFTITVVPFSTAPDSYAVSEDRLLTIAASAGVLTNDVGVGLGVRLVDAPTNGAVTLNANGSFTYLPATNFNGTDTFTYQATNSLVASAPTAVTITVSPVNDAPSAAYSTNEVVVLEDAGARSFAGFATFTAGPTNESAQTLVAYTVSNSSNALFSVQPAIDGAGQLTFTPATNANGSATVTVIVQDSGGTGDSGVDKATNTFVITVTPVNDQPTAALAGNVTVLEDAGAQTRTGFVTSFVPGPTDEAGQTPSHQVASDNALLFSVPPAIASDGTLTFTPATNANGSATVTVITSDSSGTANGGRDRTTNSFLVTVTPVNDAPSVAFATNLVAVLEDAGPQSLTSFATFTAGPTNEAAQALVGYTVSNSSNALFSVQPAIDGTGQFTFTPATNANGSATVTVIVQDNGGTADGGVDRSTNTFTLTLTPVNDAPSVAFATNLVAVLEDAGSQSIASFAAFTAGPTNEVAQALVGYTVSNSSNALFSVQPAIGNNGTLTFTPAANANGTATVTVVVQDDGGTADGGVDRSTNTFTLTLTPVNDAPSVAFSTNLVVVLEDAGPQSIASFAAFTAGPSNESAQVLVSYTVGNSSNALFSVQPAIDNAGRLTFTPATNANGSVTVTVVVQDDSAVADGGVDKSTNTFTLTVTPVNDAPSVTFAQGAVTVLEDAGAQSVSAFASFLAGPLNESAQALAGYSVTVDNTALFATAPAINNAGLLTFAPATNANGSATVTVVVQDNGSTADGGVDKSTNTFTLVVTAVNDTPVANNDSYTVSQGDVLTVAAAGVLANDTDVENNPLTATKLTDPAHGTMAFNANGGFTYTPDTNFYGVDSFTYRASDASSNSTPATVSLSVLARPVITPPPGKQRVFSSAALRFSATNAPDLNAIRVSDPDSAALTLTLTVTNGTLAVTVTNGLTFPNGSTNTNTLVLAGLITSLNDALETLSYVSVTNYFGDDTLVLVAQDEGGRTNRGHGVFDIQVVIPARGPSLDVSLNGFNHPGQGRTVTNATAVTLDTNLVQGITYDPTNNVVRVQPIGGQDGSTNRSTVTVLARYSDGTTELITVPVIIYQPLLTTTTNSDAYDATFGTPLFNLQTSLYEQKVRVQNNTPFDFTALRITATNLPATVTLQNATLTNGGRSYIDYNLPVLAGSNVTLKLEYFSSDLLPFTPGLKLELLNQQRSTAAPTNTTMSAVAARRGFSPDGAAKNYLKFPTKLGQLYYVQYQDVAGPVWKTSPVTLRGTGFFLNWLDDGPPNTDTPPGPVRFYRVVTDR